MRIAPEELRARTAPALPAVSFATPLFAVLLAALGLPASGAGLVAGLLAGWAARAIGADRRRAAVAAMATVYGTVITGLFLYRDGADGLGGVPWWIAGAIGAYVLGTARDRRRPVRPELGPSVRLLTGGGAAAVIAGALACAQLLAADRLGLTSWNEPADGSGLSQYLDLTRATWYAAVAVVAGSLAAHRLARAGAWGAFPLAAWLGVLLAATTVVPGLTGGAIYVEPAEVFQAVAIGGGIGAVTAAMALRIPAAAPGLAVYLLWVSVTEFARLAQGFEKATDLMPDHIGPAHVLVIALMMMLWSAELVPNLVLTLAVVWFTASRTARRSPLFGVGALAATAGPLMMASVYLTIGPRFYDHTFQATPYLLALVGSLGALVVAAVADLRTHSDASGRPKESWRRGSA